MILIRTLLVDDHHLIRAGIKSILSSSENIRVVAEAENGEEALSIIRNQKIDVAVVDIQMPGMAAPELIQNLHEHKPTIPSVVLTSTDGESLTKNILGNGAYSFVTKSCTSEHLIKAIEKTIKNERYLSPDIAKQLAYRLLNQSSQPISGVENTTNVTDLVTVCEGEGLLHCLSTREMQCLSLLVHGTSVKKIAAIIGINPKSVHTYRHRIYKKLNLQNDVDLIKFVTRYNLVAKINILLNSSGRR